MTGESVDDNRRLYYEQAIAAATHDFGVGSFFGGGLNAVRSEAGSELPDLNTLTEQQIGSIDHRYALLEEYRHFEEMVGVITAPRPDGVRLSHVPPEQIVQEYEHLGVFQVVGDETYPGKMISFEVNGEEYDTLISNLENRSMGNASGFVERYIRGAETVRGLLGAFSEYVAISYEFGVLVRKHMDGLPIGDLGEEQLDLISNKHIADAVAVLVAVSRANATIDVDDPSAVLYDTEQGFTFSSVLPVERSQDVASSLIKFAKLLSNAGCSYDPNYLRDMREDLLRHFSQFTMLNPDVADESKTLVVREVDRLIETRD